MPSSVALGSSQETVAAPLRSIHTESFPALLKSLGCSVVATTYQAGKLVVLRADGGVLNTHFCGFAKPMGLAVQPGRFAIGTRQEIWEYHDVPAAAKQVDELGAMVDCQANPSTPEHQPATKHDACFLPRKGFVTGDIQIHEMAWNRRSQVESLRTATDARLSSLDSLVFVNTAFSCLCVPSDVHSFRPIWKPKFISALAPEDRCHLNGLGLQHGTVRFVTALGTTDTQGGWRENKRNGGVLIDVPSNEVFLRGLSMPHSPRWYDGHLWLLESGTGTLGTVDLATLKYEPIVELPGFTRGLDFIGPYAFVGLSQVRESAIFSGIPLVDRLPKRSCGVWVVDLRIGQVVAFVEFEDALQEIFAVSVLPSIRFPEVTNTNGKLLSQTYLLPDDALCDVPDSMRTEVRA